MSSWFAVPLAIVFALATLSGQTENSSARDSSAQEKSDQAGEGSSKNRSERVCLLLSIYVPLLCVIDDKTSLAVESKGSLEVESKVESKGKQYSRKKRRN
jgi:hypothetical protein